MHILLRERHGLEEAAVAEDLASALYADYAKTALELAHVLAAESLPKIFATNAPLCWTCHQTASFRREHPELVIERPRIETRKRTLQPTTAVY